MQQQADAVLDQLFALPTPCWIDCARSYGLSEKFVGEYLQKKRNRNTGDSSVYVSSKWGYTYVADFQIALAPGQPHEVKDHSVTNFLKQLQETKELLGTDVLQLYQVHSATVESGILTDTKVHQALAATKRELGWKMGLSVSSPLQGHVIRQALDIRMDGDGNERLFDSVQCTWNLLEQSATDALLHAHSNVGCDIIIKEGLANGRILQHPVVQKWSHHLDCPPDALALAAILAQPFAPRVLSGAVTPEQLVSNFQALEWVERLQEEKADNDRTILQALMQDCVMDSATYWEERAALAWN